MFPRPSIFAALAASSFLAAAATGAVAQSAGDFGLGLGVSTLGPTVEGTYRVNDRFGLRVPAGYFAADFDGTEDGVDYDADVELGGIGLLGDFFPGAGGLRLSAGAIYSLYSVDGRGRGSGTVGNTEYTDVDLRFDGDPRNEILPTAAIGYDGRIGQRWTLSADLGAMFTGGYDITLRDASGRVSQDDIEAEIGDIEDDLPDVIPYLKFAVSFRF